MTQPTTREYASVNCSKDKGRALKVQAAREGRSIREILDELIDRYLEEKQRAA